MSGNISQKGSSEAHVHSSEQGKQLVSGLINCHVYSCTSAEKRSRSGSCRCFWKSFPKRDLFSEALGNWQRSKGGGCRGKAVVCPRVSGMALPIVRSTHMCASYTGGQSNEGSLEDDGNQLYISLTPFTHAAEAPSCSKSCPGKWSLYSTNVTRRRRVWNSSWGLLVRFFGKFIGKPPKVAILSSEGKFDLE